VMGSDMKMIPACPECGHEHAEPVVNVVPIAKHRIGDKPQTVEDYVSAMRHRANRLEQEIADISHKKRELAKIRKALRVFDSERSR